MTNKIFEVEAKFRIGLAQLACAEALPEKLGALGFTSKGTSFQEDHFLSLPGASDTVRIRFQITAGVTEIFLTAKRKVEVDGVKTRVEEESKLDNEVAQTMLLAAASQVGAPVPCLSKVRYEYEGFWCGYVCKVCLDHVTDDNCFMEVEILVEDEACVAAVDAIVEQLARQLLGGEPVRELRSHKEMLFERLAEVR